MKFQVQLKSLTDALGVVGRAVAGRGTRPILANFLFDVEGEEIRLVGTDLEIMMFSRLPAKVEMGGRFTVPAKLLLEVVTSLPSSSETEFLDVKLVDGVENVIQLLCGRTKINLQIQGVEDFPPIPEIEGAEFPSFKISAEELKGKLKEVAIAIGGEEGNPSQRAVCLSFHPEAHLTMISTDSKRLAITRMEKLSFPKEFERSFLLPGRAVPEIQKLLEAEDSLGIGFFQSQLLFSNSKFQLLSRLIDGKFPDYNRVLPKECTRRLFFKRKEFVPALKTVMPLAKHSSSMVRLDMGANETRLWSESREEGMSEAFISSRLEGEPVSIAFNAFFLLEFMNVVNEESVVLEMTTPSYPGVLKPEAPGFQFTYVVMPMTF